MSLLGKRSLLTIVRSAPPGFYLDGGTAGEILLPGKYNPPGATLGSKVDVFVYRDSEDRFVATTEKPIASVGECAYLRVVGINPRIGVFLDWGLDKDLLLPIRETAGPLNVGDRVVVKVIVDAKSDRLVASARLNRVLDLVPPPYHEGQALKLMVASRSPLGYNMIINDAHRGLVYHTEIQGSLSIGQLVEGYVRSIRPDGKIDLALGRAGYRRIASVADTIIEKLTAAGGHLPFHDNSLPEEIRDAFGISKKAFKQGIGSLFRERRIFIDPDGIRLMAVTNPKN